MKNIENIFHSHEVCICPQKQADILLTQKHANFPDSAKRRERIEFILMKFELCCQKQDSNFASQKRSNFPDSAKRRERIEFILMKFAFVRKSRAAILTAQRIRYEQTITTERSIKEKWRRKYVIFPS